MKRITTRVVCLNCFHYLDQHGIEIPDPDKKVCYRVCEEKGCDCRVKRNSGFLEEILDGIRKRRLKRKKAKDPFGRKL